MDITLERAIKILNESANGVTTFNEEYTEACKMAVRIMTLVEQGKITVVWEVGNGDTRS